jgi:hypothetical protein
MAVEPEKEEAYARLAEVRLAALKLINWFGAAAGGEGIPPRQVLACVTGTLALEVLIGLIDALPALALDAVDLSEIAHRAHDMLMVDSRLAHAVAPRRNDQVPEADYVFANYASRRDLISQQIEAMPPVAQIHDERQLTLRRARERALRAYGSLLAHLADGPGPNIPDRLARVDQAEGTLALAVAVWLKASGESLA